MSFELKSLADKMTLVRTRTKRQRRTVLDRRAADYVATATQTTSSDWVVSKRLFAKSQRYAALQTALYGVDKYVKERTAPWLDGGFRCLPNRKYLEFTQGLRPLLTEVELAAREFTDNWSAEVRADIARLGTSANVEDYPQFAPEISIDVTFLPVPDAGDFRVEVREEDRQRLVDEIKRAEDAVRDDIITRVVKRLEQISARLAEYTGEKRQRWHQDVVDSTTAMVDLLGDLNVNDDPEVEELLSSTRSALLPFTGNEALKATQSARDNAKGKVDDILARFAS